jgi:predicted dehydrogenase
LIRLGLLTTARINGAILDARSGDAPFSVDAVGSRSLERARAYAARHGIGRAHGSYAELLADPELDAVYIALPAALHHEWTMRALACGKHVLVEKPYTRRPAEVDEAWDEAERRGLVLTEGYMWRHSSQTRLLRELLGAVGEVQGMHASFYGILEVEDDVRFVPELGGGALLDLGCYCASAARLVLGEPEHVYGEATAGRGGVDVRFAGTLRFGDTVATFGCGFTARSQALQVVGADGVLESRRPFWGGTGTVHLNGDAHRVEAGDHYRAELDDFCAAIRGDGRVLVDRAEMKGQARVLEALWRSSQEGRPITLDASRE